VGGDTKSGHDRGADVERPDPARIERAADPASSSRVLWRLALLCQRPAVHRALAANPSAPPSLLWHLAGYGRWDARAIVALNPRCGRRVQARLSYAGDWAVRAAVASNPVTHPKVLGDLVAGLDQRVSLAAATNPALPADLVDTLLKHRNVFVRGAAAANPNAPEDSLRQLAHGMDEPAWVLRAIAANPSCPPELSDQLLTWIALGGADNADPMFDPVACTGHPGDTRVAVFAWYASQARGEGTERHPLWRVRAAIGQARRTLQQPLLAQLRRDSRPEVRRSVAGFTPVPPRSVRELIGDADPGVARIAAQVRKQNRERYRGIRAGRSWRLAPRLLPLVGLAGVVLSPVFHSATAPLPGGGRSQRSPAVVGPRVGSCDSPIKVSRAGAGGARVPHVSGGPAVRLPGGVSLACGPMTAADGSQVEAVVVSGGSTGVGVRVSADVVRLLNGRRFKNVLLHVLPGHNVLMTLPGDPRQLWMEISSSNMRTKVIMVYLSFGSVS